MKWVRGTNSLDSANSVLDLLLKISSILGAVERANKMRIYLKRKWSTYDCFKKSLIISGVSLAGSFITEGTLIVWFSYLFPIQMRLNAVAPVAITWGISALPQVIYICRKIYDRFVQSTTLVSAHCSGCGRVIIRDEKFKDQPCKSCGSNMDIYYNIHNKKSASPIK